MTLNRCSFKVLFVILCAVFLLWKVHILLSLPDDLVNMGEYTEKGTLTKDCLNELVMPLNNYLNTHYERGSLIVSLLAVPFFLGFGQTSFSLHLVGILFSTATWMAWMYFFRKYFGQTATILLAFVYIFSPPVFTKFTVLTTAGHNEINLLIILYLISFFRAFAHRSKIHYRYALIAGLLGAMGVFFFYTAAWIVFTSFLYLLFFNRKAFFQKPFYMFCLCLVPGFFPLARDFLLGKGAFDVLFDSTTVFSLDRMAKIFFYTLPRSFCFQDLRMGYLYFGFAFFAFVYIFLRGIRSICLSKKHQRYFNPIPDQSSHRTNEFFLAISVATFLVFYFLSNDYIYELKLLPKPFHYRHLMPLYPFLFSLITLTLTHLFNKRTISRVTIGAFLLLLSTVPNLLITMNMFKKQEVNSSTYAQGYSYGMLGATIYSNYAPDFDHAIKTIFKIPREHQKEAFRGFGFEIGSRFDIEDRPVLSLYVSDILDPKETNAIQTGIIQGIISEHYLPPNCYYTDMKNRSTLKAFRQNPHYIIQYFETLKTREERAKAFIGLGFQSGLRIPLTHLDLLKFLKPFYAKNFYHGIGMALYNDYKDDEKVRDTIFNELSLKHKQSIINGMKECHELLSFFQL